MPSTTFVAGVTKVLATWLNEVNALVFGLPSTASVSGGDALVGRKRTAVGAIASNWHLWAERQVLDAQSDFGVVADDSTDNTAAFALITTYLSSIVTASKCAIYLPYGVMQTDYFDLPSDSVVFGDGHGSAIKQRPGTTRALIQPTDTTNGTHRVTLRNFRIDGNKANVSSISAHGIGIEGPCQNWTLDGLKIHDTKGHGTQIRGGGPTATSTFATDILITNCWYYECGNYDAGGTNGRESVYANRTQNIIITNNLMELSGRQTIALEGSGNQSIATRKTIISNNILRGPKLGGGIDDETAEGGELVATSNIIVDPTGVGVRFVGLTGNSLIANNLVINAGSRCFDLEVSQASYPNSCVVQGNIGIGSGATSEGMKINAGSYMIVSGNFIRSAGTIGYHIVNVAGDKALKFVNNMLDGSGQEGVVVSRSVTGLDCSGNTVRNAGSAAFPSVAFSIRAVGTAAAAVSVLGNTVIEDRGTPYTTYGFAFSNINGLIVDQNTVTGTTATGDALFTTTACTGVMLGTNNWNWARVSINAATTFKATYSSQAALYMMEWDADAAPTLTISSNVITPTTRRAFVGAGLIKTITAPIATGGGTITLIPTAAFTTDTTGNVAIASTATIGRAMTMTYDSGTTKWYPSY